MPQVSELATTLSYQIECVHVHKTGVVQLPVAGSDPQACSYVRLHAPCEVFSIYWSAEREGAPPVLPSPRSLLANQNRVFLGGERHGVIVPCIGGHRWICAGRYDYGVAGAEGLDSMFPLAKCPWENESPTEFYIPIQSFVSGLVNPISTMPPMQTPIIVP